MAGFPEDEGALRPDDEAAPPKPKKKYTCGLCHEPGHDRRSCPHFGPRAAGPYRDIDHRKLGNGSMDALLLAVTGLEQGGPSPTTAPALAELAAAEALGPLHLGAARPAKSPRGAATPPPASPHQPEASDDASRSTQSGSAAEVFRGAARAKAREQNDKLGSAGRARVGVAPRPKKGQKKYVGVSQYKKEQYKHKPRWEAHIWARGGTLEGGAKGRQLHLGYFSSEEAAARAYDLACIYLRGFEGAATNRPLDTYRGEPVLEVLAESPREQFLAILRADTGASRDTLGADHAGRARDPSWQEIREAAGRAVERAAKRRQAEDGAVAPPPKRNPSRKAKHVVHRGPPAHLRAASAPATGLLAGLPDPTAAPEGVAPAVAPPAAPAITAVAPAPADSVQTQALLLAHLRALQQQQAQQAQLQLQLQQLQHQILASIAASSSAPLAAGIDPLLQQVVRAQQPQPQATDPMAALLALQRDIRQQ